MVLSRRELHCTSHAQNIRRILTDAQAETVVFGSVYQTKSRVQQYDSATKFHGHLLVSLERKKILL